MSDHNEASRRLGHATVEATADTYGGLLPAEQSTEIGARLTFAEADALEAAVSRQVDLREPDQRSDAEQWEHEALLAAQEALREALARDQVANYRTVRLRAVEWNEVRVAVEVEMRETRNQIVGRETSRCYRSLEGGHSKVIAAVRNPPGKRGAES